jgi:hypothetical protein
MNEYHSLNIIIEERTFLTGERTISAGLDRTFLTGLYWLGELLRFEIRLVYVGSSLPTALDSEQAVRYWHPDQASCRRRRAP